MTEKLQNLVLQAKECESKKDWDGAIRCWSQVIDLPEISEEDRAKAFNSRGLAFAKKGELNAAIRDFDKALEFNPDYADALLNRGAVFTKKGELDAAIREFDHILKIKPDNAEALYNRGLAFAKKGELDAAIRDFDQALKFKPDYAKALYNRGLTFAKKGELDAAIRNYNHALKIDPDNAEALNNRGAAFIDNGELDRAIRDYDHAIKSKPDFAEAFNNRGNAFAKKGELDAAIRDYEHAIKSKPDFAEAFNNRGLAFAKKDELERAISNFDDAIRIKPDFANAHSNRAVALARIHARETEAKYKKEYEAQLSQVSDPEEVVKSYQLRENAYHSQIKILNFRITIFNFCLSALLIGGFALIVYGVWHLVSGSSDCGVPNRDGRVIGYADYCLSDRKGVSFATLFVIAPLTLAWIAVCFPLITHLLGLRKEKRLLQVCVEDYFRKQTLMLYTLRAQGEHRQRLIAITHAHFATRSAAEFLAGWKPESEENPNPLTDAIDKAIRGAEDAASSKPTEKSPS